MENVYKPLREFYKTNDVLLVPSLQFQPEDLTVHVGSADIACLIYVAGKLRECELLVFSVEGHATLYDCDIGIGLEHKLLRIFHTPVL